MKIYLIGSLKNPRIPEIAAELRAMGHEVFDDWYAAGPNADDHWRDYEQQRGRTYLQALKGHAARNVFNFDHRHLLQADAAILVLPAGKSGHLEIGYVAGIATGMLMTSTPGRMPKTAILLDNPERWDVMYQFADTVVENVKDISWLTS